MLTFLICIALFGSETEKYALNYFTVDRGKQTISLSWELQAGFECYGITVERRTGDEDFKTIGAIKGYCGSQTEPEAYNFVDNNPVAGTENHYRLILGKESTQVRSIFYFGEQHEAVRPYPNPSPNGIWTLRFEPIPTEALNITLRNTQGQVVYTHHLTNPQEFFELNCPELSSGTYILSVEGKDASSHIKIVRGS